MSAKFHGERRRAARILLVDDHPAVRQGLAEVIRREKDLTVCGEADSQSQALQIIAAMRPDLTLVDLALKNSLGLELIKDLHARYPDLLILVVSMHEESLYAARSIRAGARGYINKQEAMTQVIAAIRQVLSGRVYLSSDLATHLAAESLTGFRRAAASTTDSLSDRELEVLELVGQGFSTLQIAQRLHLDDSTIATYRDRIKQKCNLSDALELLQFAIRWRERERV
jgi:DNA-binding NarL/FixJ family response regulator